MTTEAANFRPTQLGAQLKLANSIPRSGRVQAPAREQQVAHYSGLLRPTATGTLSQGRLAPAWSTAQRPP